MFNIGIIAKGGDRVAPSIPTGLFVSATTTNSFTVQWTASTDNVGVTGYEVYVDNVFYATTTSTSRTVTGRASGTTYSVKVRARDAAGNFSAFSSSVNATTNTPDTVPPSTPTGLFVSTFSSTSITLRWDYPTPDNVQTTRYVLYLNGSEYGSQSESLGGIFTFSGLSPSTTYTLGVQAEDAAGNRSGIASLNWTTAA